MVDFVSKGNAGRGGQAIGHLSRELTLELVHQPDPLNADAFSFGRQILYRAEALTWLRTQPEASFHAVITDPPYGLVEYRAEEQRKLRAGRGGVWRIPPTFDGARRAPLPRFTVLDARERREIVTFFTSWTKALIPTLRPGGHVLVATNPLVSPLLAAALEAGGLERRGELVRLVRTFRGGDRPKGAHREFSDISSMPRSCWEPWGLFRKPLDGTLAANLRRWQTGGLRRLSPQTPFLDVIPSGLTPARERLIAPHPSVKPQAYLRHVVRGLLPTDDGVVLDPFAGSGTTLAACEAMGLLGVGVEIDPVYFEMAKTAIPALSKLT